MKCIGLLLLVVALSGWGKTTFAADQNPTNLIALGHVALAVSDLEPALHFYVDQLGLKEAFRLNFPDGTPNLVYLRVADSETFVELFPNRKAPMPPGTTTVNHLGLVVRNLQAALHSLKDRGYPLPENAFEKARKIQADKTLNYFVRDPDGNKIELSELPPDSFEVTSRNRK